MLQRREHVFERVHVVLSEVADLEGVVAVDLSRLGLQRGVQHAEEGGLADAVGSKDGKNVSLFQCQVDIFQYGRLSGVAETAFLYLQDHRRLLLVLFSREMNTGAPMMAVRMESGSSMMLMVRDSVSIRIMKLAPRLRLTGTT